MGDNPNEAQRVSNLIGDIYDASLDPDRWTHALEKTCQFVGGCAASLLSHESVARRGQFYFSWGDDPVYTKLYVEKYVKINPLIVPTIVSTRAGEITSALDLIPQEEYFASLFYKEWARPQGYLDTVHAVIDKSSTSYAAVAVARHERDGMTDAGARNRMSLLLPHFRRAVAISKVIDLHKVEAAALADTLDGLADAMFLVDGSSRIVHANIAGHALLAQGSMIRATTGKLIVLDTQADQALHEIFANANAGDMAVGTKGIALPLSTRDGARYVAHVLPLTAGERKKASTAYSAVAAVFIRKATFAQPHPLNIIASTFKLTPAEMRVMMMIVEIGGVPDVASVLGVSETTVKTHLQHIFSKTGTTRQADLVKLVASYMSPLGAAG